MQITCPSGLKGTIRGLTVGEAAILSDKKAVRSGEVVNNILQAGWVQTNLNDVYDVSADGHIHWDSVLVGDRFYAILMIRVATYGPSYEFKLGCEACRENIQWEIELDKLTVQTMTPESIETFKTKGQFEVSFNGHDIAYRLLTGANERTLQRALRGATNSLAVVLGQRIIEIRGEPNKMRWIRDLPMGQAMELIDLFDENDGGVETIIEVLCGSCGTVQGVELPFDRPEFWAPRERRKKIK
jgi:hypothetical protein